MLSTLCYFALPGSHILSAPSQTFSSLLLSQIRLGNISIMVNCGKLNFFPCLLFLSHNLILVKSHLSLSISLHFRLSGYLVRSHSSGDFLAIYQSVLIFWLLLHLFLGSRIPTILPPVLVHPSYMVPWVPLLLFSLPQPSYLYSFLTLSLPVFPLSSVLAGVSSCWCLCALLHAVGHDVLFLCCLRESTSCPDYIQ